MAEEEKGSSSWYRVPTWDGNPREWRSFQREMNWWMASLDKDACLKFNVAARWMLRQTGVVRARCEIPEDLAATQERKELDAETGVSVVVEEADAFAGLKKLMKSLETLNGKTELDRRGDLRAQFYQELKRQPHEKISTFCTRFRTLCGEMRREGIDLPKEELGWFLRERLGLDPLRKQLLETALAGRESYEEVENECLRLFRDLHTADPLHRKSLETRSPLLGRFLASTSTGSSGSYRPSLPSSSAASMSSAPRSMRSTTSSQVSYKFKRPGQQPAARQSFVTEQVDEEPEEDEELVPDGGGEITSPSLEEVLQAEVEVLATELHEAEEEGVASEVLDELELGVERAAESLLTMREARQKLNDVRKDRGFGGLKGSAKGSNVKGKASGNIATARKQDPNNPCWDCGQTGHWLGDPQCTKPGAGLFLPPGKKKGKQVKIVEHLTEVAENVPGETSTIHDAHVVDHEVLAAETIAPKLDLQRALDFSHEVQVSNAGQLMSDKKLVGALDSACNRTCTGSTWLTGYLDALESAPSFIQQLVKWEPECEVFRFGNGGTQESSKRWRLPIVVGKCLVCVWVSVVPVPSLGLLLGRDFLDGIGAVLSFARKLLRADHLDGTLISLRQLVAGHFALQLIPSEWPRLGTERWRKLGADGVLEVQVGSKEWLSRRIAAARISEKPTHEHLITEHSARMADISFSGMTAKPISSHPLSLARKMATQRSVDLNSKRPSSLKTASTSVNKNACSGNEMSSKMGANGRQTFRKSSMARIRHLAVVGAAILAAIRAVSIPLGWTGRAVAYSNRDDGRKWSLAQTSFGQGKGYEGLQCPEPERLALASRPSGVAFGLCGGPSHGRDVAGQALTKDCSPSQSRSSRRIQDGSQEGHGARTSRGSGASLDRAARRTSSPTHRPCETRPSSSFGGRRKGYDRDPEGQNQAYVVHSSNENSSTNPRKRSIDSSSTKPRFRSLQNTLSDRCIQSGSFLCRPRSQPDGDTRNPGQIDGGSGATISGDDAANHDVYVADAPASVQQRGVGEPSRWKECDVLGSGDHGAPRRCDEPEPAVNPWAIDQHLKKGQALLISQAWNQHVADRRRVSITAKELRDVMEADWQNSMAEAMHEKLVMSMDFPDPLVTEVYTNSQNVMKEAKRRGHGVGTAMSLETGWDFRKYLHRKQALQKVTEEEPFCLVLAFPCGPWSPLMNLRPSLDLARKRREGKFF